MLHLQHPETMKIHKYLYNQHLISNFRVRNVEGRRIGAKASGNANER